jgi:HEAT repeat protein
MDTRLAALIEDLSSPDPARSCAAREALAAAGPGAFHVLVGSFDQHEAVRAAALACVAAEGAPPLPIPQLRQILRWGQAGWRAFEDPALVGVVQDAMLGLAGPFQGLVADLLRELGDPDPFVHGAAARDLETLTHYLGPLGPEDGSVATALREALTDDCAFVRSTAAAALGNLAEDPGACVPALAPLLGDPSHRVRAAAADALGAFGEEAEPAVPALTALLQDPHLDTACRAAAALAGRGRPSAEVIEGLLALARRPEPGARLQGLYSLTALGAPSREVVEALRSAAANDPDEQVREAGARGLQFLTSRHGSV